MFLIKFTWFEFGLLVKEKVGAIWTFIFPLVLLAVLVPIYSNMDKLKRPSAELKVDACGTEQQLDSLQKAFTESFSGDVVFVKHSDALYDADTYRIDLNEQCLQDPDTAEYFSGAEVLRYHSNSSQDTTVRLTVSAWLAGGVNTALERVEVLDFSVPEQRMSVEQFLVSGILAITLISTCLFGVAVSLVGMRSSNMFKKYRLFPAATYEIVLSLLFSRLLLMVVFCCFYIGVSFWYLDIAYSGMQLLPTLGVLVLGILSFTTISIAISNFFSSPATVSPFVSLLYLTSIMIGNIFFPTDMLPNWVNALADYFPVRIFVDAFRSAAFGADLGVSYSKAALVLGGWLIVSSIIAIKKFQWHAYARN